jgi:imidazole glycerol-phosphate synthase subunit HisH
MDVAIIDYGSGNLRSAAKAIERAAVESEVAARVTVTAQAEAVAAADRIVLPGVGAFAECMRGLAGLPGMVDALEDAVLRRSRPFLGICVGMQLMATTGREHGDHPGLGWIAGDVVALTPADATLKVPHMGWNGLDLEPGRHPLLAGLATDAHVYFVHSYYMRPDDPSHVLATVDYGGAMAAVVGRDNLVGTQFHPEKSQAVGLRLLSNFLRWRP